MDILIEVFKNSLMQSMLFGPVMGVVFAALFSGLTERPTAQAPVTVVRTREVYVKHVIERHGKRSDSGEAGGLLVALGIAMLFVLWKYAVHVDQIHYYIGTVLLATLSFSVAAIVLAYMKGQFTSEEWWFYLLGPLVLLSGCLYLLDLARFSFDPRITELALQNNLWQFYAKALSEYGRNFMLTHVSGVLLLCLVIIFAFLALLHYLALMNQRSAGVMMPVWFHLARITMPFSGGAWLVTAGGLLILAYVCIEPKAAAAWLTR